jgi:hypothetical protein
MRKLFILFAVVFALVSGAHSHRGDHGNDLGRRLRVGHPLTLRALWETTPRGLAPGRTLSGSGGP